MISISPAAAEHIRYLRNRDNVKNDKPLRISIKEGGCSGFSYKLDFDNKTLKTDKVFTSNGIQLIIEARSLLYIMGTILDFDGGLNGKGFVFSNPNAKDTCGCGFSFGV